MLSAIAVGSPPDARRRTMIAGMAASFGGRYRDTAEASRQAALRGMPQGAASYPVCNGPSHVLLQPPNLGTCCEVLTCKHQKVAVKMQSDTKIGN